MAEKDLKIVVVVNSELYQLGSGGVLAQTLSLIKTKEEMHAIHDLS